VKSIESSIGSETTLAQSHRAQFTAARDTRNRRIPGLYVRNGRYYAQLWMDRGDGRKTARKFPLLDESGEPLRTLLAAREALEVKRHERRENALPTGGRKPLFHAYVETYFSKATVARKRPGTLGNERQAMARWVKHLGGVRVDKITRPMLASFVDARLAKGVGKRTAALDLICLRNVLKAACEDGYISELPCFSEGEDRSRAQACSCYSRGVLSALGRMHEENRR
jgi:Phage integrase, N-terminal SAM-like domain